MEWEHLFETRGFCPYCKEMQVINCYYKEGEVLRLCTNCLTEFENSLDCGIENLLHQKDDSITALTSEVDCLRELLNEASKILYMADGLGSLTYNRYRNKLPEDIADDMSQMSKKARQWLEIMEKGRT